MFLLRTIPRNEHVSLYEKIRNFSLQEAAAFSKGIELLNSANAMYDKMELRDFLRLFNGNTERSTRRLAQKALRDLWDKKDTAKDIDFYGEFANAEQFKLSMAKEIAHACKLFYNEVVRTMRTQLTPAIRRYNPDIDQILLDEQLNHLIDVILADGDPQFLDGHIIRGAVLSKTRTLLWTESSLQLCSFLPMDMFFTFPPEKVFDIIITTTPWLKFAYKGILDLKEKTKLVREIITKETIKNS